MDKGVGIMKNVYMWFILTILFFGIMVVSLAIISITVVCHIDWRYWVNVLIVCLLTTGVVGTIICYAVTSILLENFIQRGS